MDIYLNVILVSHRNIVRGSNQRFCYDLILINCEKLQLSLIDLEKYSIFVIVQCFCFIDLFNWFTQIHAEIMKVLQYMYITYSTAY